MHQKQVEPAFDWKKVRIVSSDELPDGAVRIHLYSHENVLRPRGPMKKESVGDYILDKLLGAWDEWTNPEYGDLPDKETLLKTLHKNLEEEVNGAWSSFRERVG